MSICLIWLGSIAGVFVSCETNYTGDVETIRIGAPALEQTALIYLAENRGLFAKHGLRVIIKDYDTGVAALQSLAAGDVDIAEAAEFPVVMAICKGEPISIFACNDRFENDYLVVRKDRGIHAPADLKGKRIGVARQTINEFYLGRFLQLRGIAKAEVTIIDVGPAQYANILSDGEVDALMAWQPFVHRIVEKEGNKVDVWPAQSNQTVYSVLVANREWLANHNEATLRFLEALHEAEEYLRDHEKPAQKVVQTRLQYSADYMRSILKDHRFGLSLDQSLVVAMKDEARWGINNGLIPMKQIPDFIPYIDSDGLQQVKPHAVNIIR